MNPLQEWITCTQWAAIRGWRKSETARREIARWEAAGKTKHTGTGRHQRWLKAELDKLVRAEREVG